MAAMAAMFQAQSANWEETQEKMSQLVSPLAVLPVSCSNFSNTHSLFVLSPAVLPSFLSLSVKLGFTPILVERVLAAVAEASHLHPTTNRPIGRSHLAMCVTVVDRKVCPILARHDRGRV